MHSLCVDQTFKGPIHQWGSGLSEYAFPNEIRKRGVLGDIFTIIADFAEWKKKSSTLRYL